MVEVEVQLTRKKGPESWLLRGRNCGDCLYCLFTDYGMLCRKLQEDIWDGREANRCEWYA